MTGSWWVHSNKMGCYDGPFDTDVGAQAVADALNEDEMRESMARVSRTSYEAEDDHFFVCDHP